MSSFANISLLEWLIGGGLVALFCFSAWLLLRACHHLPSNDPGVSVDFHALKRRG